MINTALLLGMAAGVFIMGLSVIIFAFGEGRKAYKDLKSIKRASPEEDAGIARSIYYDNGKMLRDEYVEPAGEEILSRPVVKRLARYDTTFLYEKEQKERSRNNAHDKTQTLNADLLDQNKGATDILGSGKTETL